jgi:hypothetical protein
MDEMITWLRAQIAADRARGEASARDRREGLTDDELHQQQDHPAYEYRTLEGGRKTWREVDDPPEGDGWELNITSRDPDAFERFEYHEERYWRRLNPDGPAAPYVPAGALEVLAQCEARTALLEVADSMASSGDWYYPDHVLKALALAYQHRPGYRPEWRP